MNPMDRLPITVSMLTHSQRERWDEFVHRCPQATFFHLSAWQDILDQVFDHRTFYLYAERAGEIGSDARGIDDRHARVNADDLDMTDAAELGHHLAQTLGRQHQRIAAGKNDFPDFGALAQIGDRTRQCLVGQHRGAAGPHRLAAEAEAAIDGADIDQLEQRAVGIAMDHALDRTEGLVADGIGALGARDRELLLARHELPGDRIDRIGRMVMPGVARSMSRKEIPCCGRTEPSVRTRQKIQSAYWPRVVQVFCPLTTQ